MASFSPFSSQPKSQPRHVPRSTPASVGHPERHTQRRFKIPPSETSTTAPRRSLDTASNSVPFFDEQHRKWREREYNIQREDEWLWRPQTSARGDNPALGAHPPTNPLFLGFREPGVPNGIAVSCQEQRFESRRYNRSRSNSISMINVDQGSYRPPQAKQAYPYPVPGTSQKMDRRNSSQNVPVASGVVGPLADYPTWSRHSPPPLLKLYNDPPQHALRSTTTLPQKSSFSSTKVLSHFNPFNKHSRHESESYESLADDERRTNKIHGEPLRARQSMTSGAPDRRTKQVRWG